MQATRMSNQQQILVRFNDKTHVWNACSDVEESGGGGLREECHEEEEKEGLFESILEFVSLNTGWPQALLRVSSLDRPFCSVVAVSSIRGGKGGFGTLLKGQSRQAANQTTLDYGSCRDLQGRRLRSVNDEIAQRLHREWQSRVDTGQATRQEMVQALSDTSSGIAGWFLQLPAWAEKGTRKVARRQHHKQFQAFKRSQQETTRAKELQRQAEERVAASYVQSTQKSLEAVTSHLHSAVQQGLLVAQGANQPGRKRKLSADENVATSVASKGKCTASSSVAEGGGHREGEVAGKAAPEDVEDDDGKEEESEGDSEPPSAFVTLSGEVVQVPPDETDDFTRNSCPKLQGASNFATIGVLLRDSSKSVSAPSLYYEVVVHTGGLVQIGWVSDPSPLDSESGDGAGDVPGSWSYDGSRQVKMVTTTTTMRSASVAEPPQLAAKTRTTRTARSATTRTTRSATVAAAAATPALQSQAAEYGVRWKAGDVVGCLWNVAGRSLRYFVNGHDMGIAFDGVGGDEENSQQPLLVPAVSINPGEIVEFRLQRKDFQHYPGSEHNATPVGEVLLEQVLSVSASSPEAQVAAPSITASARASDTTGAVSGVSDQDTKPAAAIATAEQKNVDCEKSDPTPIDLDDFDSADALELLGLDRLKAGLQSRGLKCGGTARERAIRLLAVKGLPPNQFPAKLLAKK
jgi:Replication stress response SDE2 C-terminal/SPRY domain/Silencing defective 2 N-terminal ubiquitin domain